MSINIINQARNPRVGNIQRGVNAIQAEVDGIYYNLPEIVPNKIELEYAQTLNINLNNSILQFVYTIPHPITIRNQNNITRITNDYRRFINRHNTSLTDFYFQFIKDRVLTPTERHATHQIQVNAGAKIISDCELDKNQSVQAFENQILPLRQQFPDHIISPTLDIGIEPKGLFANKLRAILDNDFKRFNIIYRSIPQNISNWIDLSFGIFGKKVWCNTVGVYPRWQRSTTVSLVSTVFLLGVHTVSMGYPWRGSDYAKRWIFNSGNHMFNNPTRQVTYPECRVASVSTMTSEMIIARGHIMNGTFFTQYVPSKAGLVLALRSIP